MPAQSGFDAAHDAIRTCRGDNDATQSGLGRHLDYRTRAGRRRRVQQPHAADEHPRQHRRRHARASINAYAAASSRVAARIGPARHRPRHLPVRPQASLARRPQTIAAGALWSAIGFACTATALRLAISVYLPATCGQFRDHRRYARQTIISRRVTCSRSDAGRQITDDWYFSGFVMCWPRENWRDRRLVIADRRHIRRLMLSAGGPIIFRAVQSRSEAGRWGS